jgi:hypothetical protein
MEAIKDLKWLLAILVIIWIVWFFMGGKLHQAATSGPFINPPAIIQ